MTFVQNSDAPALLPEGLRDVLPPQAEAEAALLRRLLHEMTAHGYERVQAPLLEFEDSLLGSRIGGAPKTLFRMMDPVSQRMLAVRADMTTQVARIAVDRLGHFARPLRLAYAGPVLRVKGTQLRADRQFQQAGAELIGRDDVAATAEIIAVSVEALRAVNVPDISVDLTMPEIVGAIAAAHGLDATSAQRIQSALDGKHADALGAAAGDYADKFAPLLSATGAVAPALEKLRAAYPSGRAAEIIADMAALYTQLQQWLPGQAFTLDPTEHHGFEYQTWAGFSIFSRHVRGEVGRGGTYEIRRSDGSAEKAVGFSIYLDGLVEAGAGVELRQRILVPQDISAAQAQALRTQGWSTVRDLSGVCDEATAQAQRCSHFWNDGAAQALKK